MKTAILSTLAVVTLATLASAQIAVDASIKAATKVAQEALGTFARLVNAQNYRAMGFESPDQVRSATLGVPLRAFMIRLDELQKYERGQNPAGLLRDTERFTFPIQVKARTLSSLTVGLRESRWHTISFGAPSHARLITEVLARLTERERSAPAEFFEVEVPALNVWFVGSRAEGQVILTPIANDLRFRFEKGATLPAEEVLERLADAARKHDGLPS